MTQIKVIGNIEGLSTLDRFKEADKRLISFTNEKSNFGLSNDYVEYYIYDIGGNLLNQNYNYKQYKLPSNTGLNPDGTYPVLEIDPINDIQSYGYSTGEFALKYNFFRKKISDINAELFIKNISDDRTEISVVSNILSNDDIKNKVLELINEINNSTYYKTYLLNFGFDKQVVVVNVALNQQNDQYEILFKLYEPLPLEYSEKIQLWVVDEIIDSYIFNVNLDKLVIPNPLPKLKGPNFDIEIDDKNTISTQYQNYNDVLSNYQSTNSSASYYQILSFTTSQSIDINVDYSDFSNFSKFGSVYARINNFYDKIQDIENNQNLISSYTPYASTTASLALEISKASASIANTIANFDGYEHYLYFESNSIAWPKSSITKPFILYTTGSSQVTTWLTNTLSSASLYDEDNSERLYYTLPQYIREDSNNQQGINFVDMLGHYFDNIWIYLKSVTDLYKSYNNLETGVSKDLVYYALRSLGVKTYNSKENENLSSYLIGNNTGSVNFDDDFTITGSYLNNISRQDLLAESFKRMYHNVSLLFKSKGTRFGLDSLENIYGISSSILEVKEYGGLNKTDYLKGYTTEKIKIYNSNITGSVLSPYVSVQQEETASNSFYSFDNHKIDISFSPQSQIDNIISSSISSSYPTFNIDNYIGDPRLAFSSSYPELLYTASGIFKNNFNYGFDYKGFISYIKYFDNSLFKTIKDYIPGRANLSTGVLIRSPQIERIKFKQVEPLFSTESIQEATYSIAEISECNDYLYNYLPNDKAAFYTGEFSSSLSNINDYFLTGSSSPYLQRTSSITLPSPNGNNTYNYYDPNIFEHTDYNISLNVVSSSRMSNNKLRLEPIYVNNTIDGYSSSYYAELQDSNDTLKSYMNSRYDGVRVYSLTYNTYSTASLTYGGDNSYGKTAVIDKQVGKIGLFSQVNENKFLLKRNDVALKYLIDENGNLTELNQQNKHWEEVQRTFIGGDILNISLFDNQKYGNQKLTDGSKLIFDSGYSYYPILYFSSCSADPLIYFENTQEQSSYLATAQNFSTSSYYISGSTNIGFPISGGNGGAVINIFNQELEDSNNVFTPGTLLAPPTYSVAETSAHKVYSTFQLDMSSNVSLTSTWSLQLYKNDSVLYEDLYNVNLSINATASVSASDLYAYDLYLYSDTFGNRYLEGYPVISTKPIKLGSTEFSTGTTFYAFDLSLNADGINTVFNSGFCSMSHPLSFGKYYSVYSGDIINFSATSCTSPFDIYESHMGTGDGYPLYLISDFEGNGNSAAHVFTIDKGYSNANQALNLVTGDKLNFQFKLYNASTPNYTASISQGSMVIGSLSVSTGYASTDCSYFQSASFSASIDEIIFDSGVTSFYNSEYLFVPNPLSGSENSLYNLYGDVDYSLKIKPFDIIVMYLSDGTIVEARVLQAYIDGDGLLRVQINKTLSSLIKSDLANGNYSRFLILTRVEDETNIHVTFKKRQGPTSYGIIIPSNIHPDVLDKIDVITENAKKRLIELGGIDGGTF